MGLMSDLLKKLSQNKAQKKYAKLMNGNTPIFSQFGQNVYASDVVQQAINCIVSEMKKLRPEHIRENGNDVIPINSSLQRVLKQPNHLMTTSDFLEKIIWLLFLNYNVFIIPLFYEWKDKDGTIKRKYEALYPIQPSQVDFLEDLNGNLFVKFGFNNGESYTLNYADIIHVKYRYSVNEYMGGNEQGQPDNNALLTTLNLNHQLLQGVAAAMKSSMAINGVVKINTIMDEGKTEEALRELESKLKKSEHGFLAIDLRSEFIPIKKEIQLVDATTLKFIDEKILRHFGVPLSVLSGEYSKEQYEAFYQKTLEPIIISLSQAFTKTLFTDREKSMGNKIQFYPKDLIFMSIDQTIEMVTLLSNTGALFENEKRVAFGLRPLPELEGKRFMSLNWIDATKANQYQIGGVDDEQGQNDNEGV